MGRVGVTLILTLWAGILGAQEFPLSTDIERRNPNANSGLNANTDPNANAGPNANLGQISIVTLDVDQMFAQSLFGLRILNEYTARRDTLIAENRRIADALREEELALAGQRATMAPAVFSSEAEAFDEKAQGIRRAQDTKERELEILLSEGRSWFLEVSYPVLEQLMLDRGASAILERRSVLLSRTNADITQAAVALIDVQIGDGSNLSPAQTGQENGAEN